MDTNEADLADESTFESQYSPDNDGIYSTQDSLLSLHGSAGSDGLNYGPSLPSSPPKVQRGNCGSGMLEAFCFSSHGFIIRLKCSFVQVVLIEHLLDH